MSYLTIRPKPSVAHLATTALVFALALVLGTSGLAGAHSCALGSIDPPKLSAEKIKIHSQTDCVSAAVDGDSLEVELWRVISSWPDTYLGSGWDFYPPNKPGLVYDASYSRCAYPDSLNRNYKNKTIFSHALSHSGDTQVGTANANNLSCPT